MSIGLRPSKKVSMRLKDRISPGHIHDCRVKCRMGYETLMILQSRQLVSLMERDQNQKHSTGGIHTLRRM